MEPMLKVTDLAVSYGHVEALRGINVEVHKGQIVSIIGANGAGKTTLLRRFSGLVMPRPAPSSLRAHSCPASRARSSARALSMCRKAASASPA